MKRYAMLLSFLLIVTGLILVAQAPPTTPGTPAPSTNPTSAGSAAVGAKPLTAQQKADTLALYRKLLLAQLYFNVNYNAYQTLIQQEIHENGYPDGTTLNVNSDNDSVTVVSPAAHPVATPKPPVATKPQEKK